MSAMRWTRVRKFEDALRHRNEAMCEMEIYSNYLQLRHVPALCLFRSRVHEGIIG